MRRITCIGKRILNLPALLEKQILNHRVKENKQALSSRNIFYNANPKLSLIVQFFNKKRNIKLLIERLRLITDSEIIIIDDGSVDGSHGDWIKYLDRPNDFLLRCNDIFEIRTYDRAIKMAKGDFICLLQDDDIPPSNTIWVEQALNLFNSFPKLIILGGRDGLELFPPDPPIQPEKAIYSIDGDIAGCPGVNKYRIYNFPIYNHPDLNIPFMFSMAVNRAPTFLRRSEFLEMGGINQEYAPFQCDDVDASIRTWLLGGQVGLYCCPFARDIGTGGMRLFNSAKVSDQARKNWNKIYVTYGSYIKNKHLPKLVDQANSNLH